MGEMIRVKAVPGAMLPSPTKLRAFVGYEAVGKDDPADHIVPGGSRYRMREDGELVENTASMRKALRNGSVVIAAEPAQPSAARTLRKSTPESEG